MSSSAGLSIIQRPRRPRNAGTRWRVSGAGGRGVGYLRRELPRLDGCPGLWVGRVGPRPAPGGGAGICQWRDGLVTLLWCKRIWLCREADYEKKTWIETSETIGSTATLTERARAEICRRWRAEEDSVAALARGSRCRGRRPWRINNGAEDYYSADVARGETAGSIRLDEAGPTRRGRYGERPGQDDIRMITVRVGYTPIGRQDGFPITRQVRVRCRND
jgi:hypothetical protein